MKSTIPLKTNTVFRMVDRRRAIAILARNHVGRMAHTFHDVVDIVPVHYVHDGEWLYGRTQMGPKIPKLLHHPWVAFEVDEIEGLFDWRSVVVKGPFQVISENSGPAHVDVRQRAVTLLRQLLPTLGTPDDPAGFRTLLFRIHLSEVTAREARTK